MNQIREYQVHQNSSFIRSGLNSLININFDDLQLEEYHPENIGEDNFETVTPMNSSQLALLETDGYEYHPEILFVYNHTFYLTTHFEYEDISNMTITLLQGDYTRLESTNLVLNFTEIAGIDSISRYDNSTDLSIEYYAHQGNDFVNTFAGGWIGYYLVFYNRTSLYPDQPRHSIGHNIVDNWFIFYNIKTAQTKFIAIPSLESANYSSPENAWPEVADWAIDGDIGHLVGSHKDFPETIFRYAIDRQVLGEEQVVRASNGLADDRTIIGVDDTNLIYFVDDQYYIHELGSDSNINIEFERMQLSNGYILGNYYLFHTYKDESLRSAGTSINLVLGGGLVILILVVLYQRRYRIG